MKNNNVGSPVLHRVEERGYLWRGKKGGKGRESRGQRPLVREARGTNDHVWVPEDSAHVLMTRTYLCILQ